MIITLCRSSIQSSGLFKHNIFLWNWSFSSLPRRSVLGADTENASLQNRICDSFYFFWNGESLCVTPLPVRPTSKDSEAASKWTVECVETSIMFSFNYRFFSSLSIREFVTLLDRQLTVDGQWREKIKLHKLITKIAVRCFIEMLSSGKQNNSHRIWFISQSTFSRSFSPLPTCSLAFSTVLRFVFS